MSINLQLDTQTSNKLQQRLSVAQLGQKRASLAHPSSESLVFLPIASTEALRISLVVESSLEHLTAGRYISLPAHFYRQGKAIKKLRTQTTLFWIHRPDEREACGMTMGDPLTLYMIDAHSCDIQEDIDQVVLEEIHLIDIENLLMSTSQDTGREAQLSRRQSMLHIDRANELILRRSYR